jgi:hypothetical protein
MLLLSLLFTICVYVCMCVPVRFLASEHVGAMFVVDAVVDASRRCSLAVFMFSPMLGTVVWSNWAIFGVPTRDCLRSRAARRYRYRTACQSRGLCSKGISVSFVRAS